MKGFRTFLAAWVGAVLTPWLLRTTGLELDAQGQEYLVAGVMAAIMSGMRFVTSTPAFKSIPKPVILTAQNVLEHIDVTALVQKIREHQVKQQRSSP